jgi:hypothetical protein
MPTQLIHFLAIVFLALIFAPAAAHAFALMNKINMNQQDYYAAQLAYRRWDLFGWPYLGALIFTCWLALASRGGAPSAFWLSTAAFVLTVLSLVIFLIWVLPGNVATKNWTIAPANWEALRLRWEWDTSGARSRISWRSVARRRPRPSGGNRHKALVGLA